MHQKFFEAVKKVGVQNRMVKTKKGDIRGDTEDKIKSGKI